MGSRDDGSPLTIDPAAPFFIIVHAGSGRAGTIPPREIIEGVLSEAGREHHVAVVEDPSRLLLTARAYPVQVGLVNDRVFLVNASLGLYPKIIEDREGHERRAVIERLDYIEARDSFELVDTRELLLDGINRER